ncbi:MAG: phosphopantetheine-binding protein [Magnetovibrionaceae bacterium]
MTETSQPLDVIREVIKSIQPKAKCLALDDAAFRALDLSEDVGLDSLDFINFLFKIEQLAGKSISAEDIDDQELTSIANLEKYLG